MVAFAPVSYHCGVCYSLAFDFSLDGSYLPATKEEKDKLRIEWVIQASQTLRELPVLLYRNCTFHLNSLNVTVWHWTPAVIVQGGDL